MDADTTRTGELSYLFDDCVLPRSIGDTICDYLLLDPKLPSLCNSAQHPHCELKGSDDDADDEFLHAILEENVAQLFSWRLSLWSSPTQRLSQDVILPLTFNECASADTGHPPRNIWAYLLEEVSTQQLQAGQDVFIFCDLINRYSIVATSCQCTYE